MALDVPGIQRSLRKLRKLLKKAPHRPSPGRVHDLRTHARRFEATLEALGLHGGRNVRRLMASLGTLRSRAGKLRDMDVLTSYTASVPVNGEQECLVELLEYLGAERYRHARRLRRLIRQDAGAMRRRLRRTSKRIDKRIPADGMHGAHAKEAMAIALTLSSELATPATLTRKTLHPYRLKVKQLRNVLRMATDADANGFVTRLGEIKDAIGEWHDWETLVTIAEHQLDHGARCRFLRELRRIRGRKYEQALSLTNGMRNDYLRPSRRGSTGRFPSRRTPVSLVLEATAAMAS